MLHDVFGVPFDSIAETVGRPVGTCRQLARRARAKFLTAQPKANAVAPAEHQLVTEKFITACANGDIAGLAAVLDPTVWGVGTILADPAPPPQINHGPHAVATNLLRYLWPEVTLVSGPVGQPVLLAFSGRRLFAVIVLTIRESRVAKIEAIADPSARTRTWQPRSLAGPPAVVARREIPGDRCRDLEEFAPRRGGHFAAHIDDAARAADEGRRALRSPAGRDR